MVVVALLPVYTDTIWFRDYASHAEIELLKGRLQFLGSTGFAPVPHMIAVWRQASARSGDRLAITLSNHRRGIRPCEYPVT
jgi:hypothetical protein